MTITFGIYPFIGIALAALLYAIHRFILRMKCSARFNQRFIIVAIIATLVVTLVHPIHIVRPVTAHPVHLSKTDAFNQNDLNLCDGQTVVSEPKSNQFTELMQTSLTKPALTGYNSISSQQENVNIIVLIYIIGIGIMVCYIISQLVWLLKMRLSNKLVERKDGICIYNTNFNTPFSFGKNIFLPASLEKDMRQYVLMHECSHVHNHHFLHLFLTEVMVAVQWFNPFAWVLLNELKLQQEMEVDTELMQNGVDREAYQISLLRLCSNSGRWVLMQTAFGTSSLKWRILFMNRQIHKRTSRKRMIAATISFLLLVSTSLVMSCRTEKEKSPLDGCWRTDWIRNSDDKFEHVVSLYNNKFWGNNMMINFSWFERYKEVNMRYNFSGEQQIYSNGKLHTAKGDTLRITWLDDDNVQEEWNRDPDQVELVDGAKITEQRHRVKPDKGAMRILRAMYTAGEDRSHRICGVWQWDNDTTPDIDHYFVVNGDIFFTMSWYYSDKKYLRRGAGGWSGDFRWISENAIFLSDRTAAVKWKDNDHITIYTPREEYEDIVSYHRIKSLPEDLHLLLTAAFPQE